MSNELPQLFDWDAARNAPGDRWARPELSSTVVEFVAPTEYMVRPPQPAVYIFLIDVSHAAVQSGKLDNHKLFRIYVLRDRPLQVD
jgi:protein transport protein SEC24